MRFWISIGSNIQVEDHFLRAAKGLRERLGSMESSGLYWNPPIGRPEQPDYLNGVWLARGQWKDEDFKAILKAVENLCDRTRVLGDDYASRTMDLDWIGLEDVFFDLQAIEARAFLRRALTDLDPSMVNKFIGLTEAELSLLDHDVPFSNKIKELLMDKDPQ
ncbi:MAG: 2-amino-4-hydroxy-6-hydroxymethyldihydropteridine diphosphokinase [Spirochaetaceae bacterium]|jgi:2-amino-4-hydroxy-6-hydroxymethyldihydropteridine diphosphokinase|nr:2-amino-4-hydroxy-6-hydroxymethyldihydropteridine diphosphokinase [Spirochaetaceae bacterium]